jgi:hypothetical protein
MAQVSLLAYFSAGAFLNLAFFDLYYVIVALAVLARAVVRREVGNQELFVPIRQPVLASQTDSPSNSRSTAGVPTRILR